MCYSALIKASLKEVSASFRALLGTDEFRDLFLKRLTHPEIKIPRGIDRYFAESPDPRDSKLAPLVRQFYLEERERDLQLIGETRREMRELSAKPTAANKKKIEVRERKLLKIDERVKRKLEEPHSQDFRVYPLYYAPVIVAEGNERRLVPMRYRVRAADGGEVPAKYNTFNARHDSLLNARTWAPLFGKTHLIFPFERFYEWVERNGKKREIFFSPEGKDLMWAAGIYSPTKGEAPSFAMVTDDPPPEVLAAGHDRCPIFLAEAKIEAWLHPQNLAADSLLLLLKNTEKPHYSNGLVA